NRIRVWEVLAMSEKAEHPSIKRFRERAADLRTPKQATLDAQELREIVLRAGADDAGFVEVDREGLGPERADILRFFPHTKSLICFVRRMIGEPISAPAVWVANVEFHQWGEGVNESARHIVSRLEARSVRAVNPAMGFPMEMANVGNGKLWIV